MKYAIIFLTLMLIGCSNSNPKDLNKESAPNITNKLRALIIDGENNHGVWPKTTMMMKDFLKQTDRFEVDIYRTTTTYQGPHHGVKGDVKKLLTQYPLEDDKTYTSVDKPTADPNFSPDFDQYDVVISNLGWQSSTWPKATVANFEKYMADGGGLVIIHAANNAWGDWDAFNQMIGLGAWGDRNTDSGPYVYYDDNGTKHVDPSDGQCGSHGPEYEFVITTRNADHPIMKGIPSEWLHTKDELYDRMRGPAENMTVLATAYSDVEGNAPPWDPKVKGSNRHEPMLIAVDYKKGRVFHSALGHMDYSFECVGFMTTFQRGAEWAATGKVTIPIPDDFPSKDQSSARSWKK